MLFDRDGTLVVDVPHHDDPSLVVPVPTARSALDVLRLNGIRTGVVTNQSGVARGLQSREQVAAVNDRVEELLGPFDTWQVCQHGPTDGCPCRKPAPGMVHAAARDLGVRPDECVVVGDTVADVMAARAAGVHGILVPNRATRRAEVAEAPSVAGDLQEAATLVLGRVGPSDHG